MLIERKFSKYIHKLIDAESLKSDLVNIKVKKLTIQFQYIFSILAYLVIIHGYYLANYFLLMNLTIISMGILAIFLILKWKKTLSTKLSSILFIYIPILNIFCKDIFFFINKSAEIKTIFLHTHFMLLLFISFGGLISRNRHILYVGIISVVWIWIFTILINDPYLWSLITLDTVFFIGISLVVYRTYTLGSIFQLKQKELFYALGQQNTELNKLINLKDWMLNMIIHDIKNPINRILFACEANIIVKDEILQPSKHILAIVENILDVYKLEDSTIKLRLTNESLETIIKESYEEIKYLLDSKNITVKQTLAANYIVNVDLGLLVRVLVNLLTNSIKSSELNSCIEIRAISKSDKVRVEVIDNGIGIAPENIDHIFEKYYQINACNIGNYRSTGIGLTFCKLMIESHGGTMGAESKLNNGTKIWFELPLISEQNPISKKTDEITLNEQQYYQTNEEILLQYKSILTNLAVYKTSEIFNIFESFPGDSPELLKWKEDVIKSAIAGNTEHFYELVSLNDDEKNGPY